MLYFKEDELEGDKNVYSVRANINYIALESSDYYVMRSGPNSDDLNIVIDGDLARYKPNHTYIASSFCKN